MCWCQGERQLGFRVPAIWSDSNWPIVIGFVCTSTSTHGKPGTRSRAGLNGGRIGRIRLAFRFVNSYCRKKPQRKDGPFILLNDSFDFTWFNRFFFGRDFFHMTFHDFSMILPCFFHVFLPQTGAGPENASIEEVAPMVLGALGEAVRSMAPWNIGIPWWI